MRGGVGYRDAVSILQTLAVFVGAPALIYGLIAVFTVVAAKNRKRRRYNPGDVWSYPPQWWAGDHPVAITAGGSPIGDREGGARGEW